LDQENTTRTKDDLALADSNAKTNNRKREVVQRRNEKKGHMIEDLMEAFDHEVLGSSLHLLA
tara:strand:+ start:463 stop:648 length:186 start_codon:yes stop_codon:yes gene_type:complete